jgi:hypothetical protein
VFCGVTLAGVAGCGSTPTTTSSSIESPAYVLPKWTIRNGYISDGAELWVAGYHLGTDG